MHKKLLLSLLVLFFLITPQIVWAEDGYVTGRVFVKGANGQEIGIPGVIIFKMDKEDKNWTGPVSITDSNGNYGFYRDHTIGGKGCNDIGNSNKSCELLRLGQNASQKACTSTHNHCGFSCNDKNTPQKWFAYFPKNFDKSVLQTAGVYFKDGDMKGGGSWIVDPAKKGRNMSVNPGGSNWVVDAQNFGSVTYGPNEWLIADTSSNSGNITDIKIQWTPGLQPVFQCSSLNSSAITTNLAPGSTTSFTCSSTITGYTLKHYNYRIHTPTNDATIDSANYWTIPSGWTAIIGATPFYTIPQSGSYKVQCQVCRNPISPETDPVCTNWGQANAN